ncbi:MAG: molybdopterin cofactor-binding domain-containing protein, partial [Burkholderiales bacterium]
MTALPVVVPPVVGPRVVGERARRIEDPALLRGKGRYVDDVPMPGAVHAAFVRSQHAHALVRSIDTKAAEQVPGVVAIYTGRSIVAALTRLRMPLGFPTKALPQDITPFVLADREVCFVGEPIAIVLADSRYIAEDAAALVEIDYEPLPILADCRDSIVPGSPKVRLDAASNVLTHYHIAYGEVAKMFASAAHVSKVSLSQHRGGAHSIEGRGVLANYSAADDALTVWSSTQMSHDLKFTLADMLGLAEARVRVIAPDVGGGFGAKFMVYPEEVAVAA